MPDPIRTSTSPSTSSAISASRTLGRDTPSCFARSRSGGSRDAGREFAGLDQASDLVGDLPVQAAGLDALERHGGGAVPGERDGARESRRLSRARELVKWYDQLARRPWSGE